MSSVSLGMQHALHVFGRIELETRVKFEMSDFKYTELSIIF